MRAFQTGSADALRLALLAALGLPCWVACGSGSVESLDPQANHTGGVGSATSTGGSHSDSAGGTVSTGGAIGGGGSTGSGGALVTGGAGGALVTGGTAGQGGALLRCTNPQPLLPGHDTGYFTCEEGFEHRAEQKDCPSSLPRSTQLPPSGGTGGTGGEANLDECLQDSDCPGPNDYCTKGGYFEGPNGRNICVTGCVSDSDCDLGGICRCGDPIGMCTHPVSFGDGQPGCKADADCGEGLCAGVAQEYGCSSLPNVQYACQRAVDECQSKSDCGDFDNCSIAYQEPLRRTCLSAPVCGRPFLVDFLERRAEPTGRADWTLRARSPELAGISTSVREQLAAHWTDIALMEHASIAAFARFSLQLLALGAPADLIEETNRALADETKHARLCFALASSYRGAPVGPGRLDITGSLEGATPEAILRTVIHEGCIGETHAALEAAESRALCSDPAVSEVLEVIMRDEARHAELAWRFVQWLLEERPELRAVAESEFASVRDELSEPREVSAAGSQLGRYGALDASARRAVRRRALESVVVPCASSLLARVAAHASGEEIHAAESPRGSFADGFVPALGCA